MNNMCESLYRKTFDVRQYSASWILLWVQQYKAGADWLFKVNYPLWVSQPGKLSLPSLMGRQMSSNLMDYAALQGRTGSSNWPWKSRQAGPICSGVTRNSVGAFTNIQAQPFLPICGPVAPLPRTTLSFTLLLFVTLCLAPFSPILITLSLFAGQVVWPILQYLTSRPTWPSDQPAHLASTMQVPCGPVRRWYRVNTVSRLTLETYSKSTTYSGIATSLLNTNHSHCFAAQSHFVWSPLSLSAANEIGDRLNASWNRLGNKIKA